MTQRNSAEFASLREAVWQHRLRGLTGVEIAQALGIPQGTVYRWLKEMVEQAATRGRELADEGLQLELARLDRYLAILEQRIDETENPEALIPTALKLGERRAKLLGLDAAQKVEATVHEVTQEDLAIAELVRDAQAAAALEERRIKEEQS